MAKSLENNFTDWENDIFGYGYGTGEPHTLAALKTFLGLCEPPNGSYQYEALEAALTPTAAWLMLNILGHANIIEYGTSPRYGWLTKEGRALKAFVDERTFEQLCELSCPDQDYNVCYRNACNCGPNGYQKGVKCVNPFW